VGCILSQILIHYAFSYSKPIPFEEHWGWEGLAKATKIYIDMVGMTTIHVYGYNSAAVTIVRICTVRFKWGSLTLIDK